MQALKSAWKQTVSSQHRLLSVSFLYYFMYYGDLLLFSLTALKQKYHHSIVMLLAFKHKYITVHFKIFARDFGPFFIAYHLNTQFPLRVVATFQLRVRHSSDGSSVASQPGQGQSSRY